MVQEEFVNFKCICHQIPNINKTLDPKKVEFMDIRMYAVHKGDPLVTIHYNLDQPAVQMNLFQTGRKTLEMDVQMSLEPAYSRKLRIDQKAQRPRKVVWRRDHTQSLSYLLQGTCFMPRKPH
ncbi:hypothetical protein ElyMa_001110800 [Elysia marginata]|uniref:Uncharacterized protein n=1 Tax=Elysia marginata TaxID=1093978 RepID=A0AAV4HVG0_9GAST|nr:hypothetical protein ElyMa_001110800 [Elysia marginata]